MHPNHPEPNRPTIFTAAEIEKMRLYVIEHDKAASVNTFDLNNPPKMAYVHQEYPKMVHDHENRAYKTVNSAKEERDALEAGWRLEQFPAEAPEIELDAADAAEVAALDKKLAELRSKPKAKVAKRKA